MAKQNEITDGERLRLKFDALKRERGISKAAFARATKFPGGASMISQNISGNKPISLDGANAYSKGFGCTVDEISPALAARLTQSAQVGNIVGNEFPSYPVAQVQMNKALALTDLAASLGPKEAMAGLEELVGALHPALSNAGRDVLRQWVDGTLDAEKAAATLESLTHASENMKIGDKAFAPADKRVA